MTAEKPQGIESEKFNDYLNAMRESAGRIRTALTLQKHIIAEVGIHASIDQIKVWNKLYAELFP